ncbi:DEKNAAC103727 [Brettanomyces naardenensis]|uniref:DEKNAAC103727 n=1 Tax=Brettanomyces naardenensis TaxID=13370 RepID=A0A448YN66_BRENA|nr:DEKNAAC103727 [Brettanomyces naardenensis]
MSIVLLRTAIKEKKAVSLIPEGSNISSATGLLIDGKEISLDDETGFINQEDGVNEKLRAIYQCWLHHESNTTDYLADCEEKKVPVISFMERTELLSYLSGASETCQYLTHGEKRKEEQDKKETTSKSAESGGDSKRQKIIDADPFLKLVLGNEREAVDHNKALRGTKLTDFSNVAKECEYKIIRPAKRGAAAASASKSSRSHRHGDESRSDDLHSLANILKKKDPIVILSPSTSALITMGNVKSFLQDGKFVEPGAGINKTVNGGADIVKVVRNSKRFGKKVKFVVVNDVDKFFTKPEHWDRVVAVFTTGQEWQFKNYRDSLPNVLFQKVKGYYIHYNGDPVPENIQKWNLEVIPIERTRRFKDRQTSEYLWETLEKFMASRGYK